MHLFNWNHQYRSMGKLCGAPENDKNIVKISRKVPYIQAGIMVCGINKFQHLE
jgi:hypothetical protein